MGFRPILLKNADAFRRWSNVSKVCPQNVPKNLSIIKWCRIWMMWKSNAKFRSTLVHPSEKNVFLYLNRMNNLDDNFDFLLLFFSWWYFFLAQEYRRQLNLFLLKLLVSKNLNIRVVERFMNFHWYFNSLYLCIYVS